MALNGQANPDAALFVRTFDLKQRVFLGAVIARSPTPLSSGWSPAVATRFCRICHGLGWRGLRPLWVESGHEDPRYLCGGVVQPHYDDLAGRNRFACPYTGRWIATWAITGMARLRFMWPSEKLNRFREEAVVADDESIEYFVRRAEEERDAAACANNDAARQIHVELANEYLSRASQKRGRRKLGITVS